MKGKRVLGAILFACAFTLVLRAVVAPAQNIWEDTFADTSKIESLIDLKQVTETTEFGKNFTLYANNPLLTVENTDWVDAWGNTLTGVIGAVHPDVIYFPEGKDGYKFWMIYTPFGRYPTGLPAPPDAGMGPDWYWERPTLVRSNDGINWVKTNDYTNPVANPGPAGTWDSGWLADPDFIYAPGKGPNGESWFLYYTGCGGSGCAIALSLSFDGKNWTKYSTDGPIAPAYRCPSVIYDEETGIFHMWYNWGAYDIGYATSTNGINWIPYNPDTPGTWGYIVLKGTPGTFDQGGVTHMDVIKYDGKYWMYYLALPTPAYAGLVIGVATSPDGINWTKHPDPVITPGEMWQFTLDDPVLGNPRQVLTLYRPSAAIVGDTVYLYYCGSDKYSAYPGAYDWEIGLAFSTKTEPDGYVELDKIFNPAEYTPRADTMAWYHMNEGPPAYPGEYASLDPTLAWYHFNEGEGDTAYDSGGDIGDNGTLDGATWTTGLYGSGLSFDGNDRVTVPNSEELNPTDAITIEAWVNPSVHKANNYVAIKMTPGTGDYAYGMKLESTLGAPTGYSEIGAFIATPTNIYSAYGGAVPTGTWTHIAMTYQKDDANPTQIKLYQNGIEVTYRRTPPSGQATTTDTIPANTLIRTNEGPLNIGVIPVATPQYYQGVMDELRILGRALTPEEIAADGAVSAPAVLDSSGNDNHGLPISGVEWTAGMFSYGLSFDGTGYVNVPHTESLNTTQEITIEAWVNPSVNKANNYVAIKMTPGGVDYAYGMKLENTYTGYTEIGAFITESSGNLYFAYGGSVPVGEWTHVAMTYKMDETNPTHIRLYKNGVEVAYRVRDAIPAGTTIRTNSGPINIGRIPVSPPIYFRGVMDELRILSRALPPSQILADSGNGYKPSGNLTSISIPLPAGKIWDKFYATDGRPAGTNIEYSILDTKVESGQDISFLPRGPIQLHAVLTTSDPADTPILDDWSVTYKLLGDLNDDGCVDMTDFTLLIAYIRARGPYNPRYDLNGDGAVNIADARYLVTLFTNPRGTPCN